MNVESDLQIGKAGEYLVCADLILNGYIAFLSEQGLPYDVVLEYNRKLLKIQVKSTRGYKNNHQRKVATPSYIFNIGNNGKGNRRKKYDPGQVDIFALVAIDSRKIAYLPFFNQHSTLSFRVPDLRGTYPNELARNFCAGVEKYKESGMSTSDIGKELGLSTDKIYKVLTYEFKNKRLGRYFDEFSLDKCLKSMEAMWTKEK